jgi:hypothetical protein
VWKCPSCGEQYNAGDWPDHWMGRERNFTFECSCGVEFKVDVDFEPTFYVYRDSVKKIEPQPI